MKLKVKELGSTFNERPLNFQIRELEEVNFSNELNVTGSFKKENDTIYGEYYLIKGLYSGEIKLQCVRCLNEILQKVSEEFQWRFLEPKNYKKYIESFQEDSEIDSFGFEEAQNGEIDLEEIIRQQVLLDLELYPMCKPRCSDSTEIEKYSGDIGDERWAKLLEIKDNLKK